MLLLETVKHEEYIVNNYATDLDVNGVTVLGITVFKYNDGNIEVHVAHDAEYVYADEAFEAAISAELGFAVIFTEAGMQDVGLASMEAA